MDIQLAFFRGSATQEKRVEAHMEAALSYSSNARNLEAPWKAFYASIFDTFISFAGNDGSTILACRQEQPVPPPSQWQRVKPDMSISGGPGTLYPDVDLVRFLAREGNPRNERRMQYLIIAELKRSVKRADLCSEDAMMKGGPGRKVLVKRFHKAIRQVLLQAGFACRRRGSPTDDIILFAAVGPWWTFVRASREEIFKVLGFSLDSNKPDVALDATLWQQAAEYTDAAALEASEAVDDIDSGTGIPFGTGAFNFAEVTISSTELQELDGTPSLSWAKPYLYGTQRSWEMLLELGELLKSSKPK